MLIKKRKNMRFLFLVILIFATSCGKTILEAQVDANNDLVTNSDYNKNTITNSDEINPYIYSGEIYSSDESDYEDDYDDGSDNIPRTFSMRLPAPEPNSTYVVTLDKSVSGISYNALDFISSSKKKINMTFQYNKADKTMTVINISSTGIELPNTSNFTVSFEGIFINISFKNTKGISPYSSLWTVWYKNPSYPSWTKTSEVDITLSK